MIFSTNALFCGESISALYVQALIDFSMPPASMIGWLRPPSSMRPV